MSKLNVDIFSFMSTQNAINYLFVFLQSLLFKHTFLYSNVFVYYKFSIFLLKFVLFLPEKLYVCTSHR